VDGRQHIKTFAMKDEARLEQARIELEQGQGSVGASVSVNITLAEYADRWLGVVAATVKPGTLDNYSQQVRLHIPPTLGATRVGDISRRGSMTGTFSRREGYGLPEVARFDCGDPTGIRRRLTEVHPDLPT
jgi:hypothetical protein